MSSQTTPNTKFKPGESVNWKGKRYTIREIVKIHSGWVYNIRSGNTITTANVKEGDRYFSKA